MSAGRSITVAGVSRVQYAALRKHLQEHHDIVVSTSPGRAGLQGPQLSGWLLHDEGANTLQVEIDQHPQLVSPGHLIGQLYDCLATLAGAPATSGTTSQP